MTRSKLETALAVLFAAAIILAGGAALQSTPSDTVRFGSAMLKPGLLKAATIALLKSPLTLESGASAGFALGWKAENVPLAGTPVQVQAYWSAGGMGHAFWYAAAAPGAVADLANPADEKSSPKPGCSATRRKGKRATRTAISSNRRSSATRPRTCPSATSARCGSQCPTSLSH